MMSLHESCVLIVPPIEREVSRHIASNVVLLRHKKPKDIAHRYALLCIERYSSTASFAVSSRDSRKPIPRNAKPVGVPYEIRDQLSESMPADF